MDHPVKLIVSDDLQRNRVTVFFRPLLVVPHLVWLLAWSAAAVVTTIVNWFALLATGTPWPAAHRFVARYLRTAVHVGAYAGVIADPYPGFTGQPGYPIDLELPPPVRQDRRTVLFRLLLATPALALGAVLSTGIWIPGTLSTIGGVLATAAWLGAFVGVIQARMPRGLRDAGAYGLAYAAQAGAYVLLLTDRYPNSDPLAVLDDLPPDEHPIGLRIADDLRRSRASTCFRLVLALPLFAWLWLWGVGCLFAMVANWFAVLVRMRSPARLHRFLAGYLRFATHVYAYTGLLADPYPGFTGRPGYPVDLVVADPARQDQLTVVFRAVYAVPTMFIASAYGCVAGVAMVLGWFATLARAEMPLGLRNAIALWLRYNQQALGYLFVLTDRYPYGGPTLAQPAAPEEPVAYLPPDAYATV